MGIDAKLLALVTACSFSLGIHAETVDTIRVFEHDYPSSQVAANGRCVQDTATGASGKWYEVTYAYQGRIFREIVGYLPGKTIEVLATGKPMTVPYDNRR